MQRDQLASHEAKLVQLGNDLAEHKRNAPPSKGLQHQNYIEKDVYLLYEVSKCMRNIFQKVFNFQFVIPILSHS